MGSCEHGIENSGVVKGGEIREKLSDRQLLQKESFLVVKITADHLWNLTFPLVAWREIFVMYWENVIYILFYGR